jgi:hypothetical protein
VAVSVLGSGCGAGAAIRVRNDHVRRERPAAVARSAPSVTIRFGAGRETRTLRMRRPAGLILLYRISAPAGVRIRGSAQLPDVSAPLQIRTVPYGPSSTCARRGSRVICTVGEEGCPMPEGTWHFRLRKAAGPAGAVTLRFHVGPPPVTGGT